jgi:hypothetical protein
MIPRRTIKKLVKPTSRRKEVSAYNIKKLKGVEKWCHGLYSHSVKYYSGVRIEGKLWHPFPSNPITTARGGRRRARKISDEFRSAGYVTKIIPVGENGSVDVFIRRENRTNKEK